MSFIKVILSANNRQSNIEALRLLSMLMVLNLHSFWGYTHGEGFSNFFDFFRESTSICAVDIFILISGYFGIKWKFKSFYNLLFQIALYSFGVYFAAVLLGFISYDNISFLKCFGCYFRSWGFITQYIVLYVLSPLLNKFSESCSKKELLIFIVLLFIAENSICITTGILNYILLYLIGRFIRNTNVVSLDTKRPWVMYIICTLLITVITYLLFRLTPIKTAELMTSIPLGYSYSSPFVIIQAIILFLCFARLSFTSRFINWCATSCLAIFLIHMHPAIKQIGYYSITENLYNKSSLEHFVILILLFFVVFIGSIIIDKLRIIISELVYRLLCTIKKLLPNSLFSIKTCLSPKMKEIIDKC